MITFQPTLEKQQLSNEWNAWARGRAVWNTNRVPSIRAVAPSVPTRAAPIPCVVGSPEWYGSVRAAHHESSHCIAMIALWGPRHGIISVEIDDDGGRVKYLPPHDSTLEERLIVAQAGPGGDRMHQACFPGLARENAGSVRDRELIQQDSVRTITDYEWELADRQAEPLLLRHYRAKAVLAAEILKRRHILGDDVFDIVYPELA